MDKLNKEQVEAIAGQVVAESRGGMRVVIGDSTPKQYDRADQMASYISNAVKRSLHKLGYSEEDHSYS